MTFLKSLRLAGLLSFPPDAPTLELLPLNVIIGPNGSGKSNLIEGIELLRAAPTAFAAAIRDGGGVHEWLWKGEKSTGPATIEAVVSRSNAVPDLRYRLSFSASGQRTELVDEVIEEAEKPDHAPGDVRFYYRFQNGNPTLKVLKANGVFARRPVKLEELVPDESILSQRKSPDEYPELTWLGQRFARIQSFREWSFGRDVPLRQPQPADLPSDVLLPDSRNLALLLNAIEHSGASVEFNRELRRFLPRYERCTTRILGGTVQFYLHESQLHAPIPATRLSDGTIRFMTILALLLSPNPPPLVCIEEPELGLHPDAIALLPDLLIAASRRMQLIVTTHSDGLVSGLSDEAGSVLVCEHRNGTVLERIDPPRLAHWLDEYRLGEIWRIGAIGGNP